MGTQGNIETLRTKGAAHSDLTGFHEVERKYPDQTITDTFRIVRKLGSQNDAEGNCYDWYEIDRHYRMTDRTGALAEQTAESLAAMEDVLCEQDAGNNEHISALEDALCELDALINQ